MIKTKSAVLSELSAAVKQHFQLNNDLECPVILIQSAGSHVSEIILRHIITAGTITIDEAIEVLIDASGGDIEFVRLSYAKLICRHFEPLDIMKASRPKRDVISLTPMKSDFSFLSPELTGFFNDLPANSKWSN